MKMTVCFNKVFAALSLMLFVALLSLTTAATAETPKPEDDPKHASELRRAAANGEAHAMIPGVECPTGDCYKNADGTLGYAPETKIAPNTDSAVPSKSKDGKVTY